VLLARVHSHRYSWDTSQSALLFPVCRLSVICAGDSFSCSQRRLAAWPRVAWRNIYARANSGSRAGASETTTKHSFASWCQTPPFAVDPSHIRCSSVLLQKVLGYKLDGWPLRHVFLVLTWLALPGSPGVAQGSNSQKHAESGKGLSGSCFAHSPSYLHFRVGRVLLVRSKRCLRWFVFSFHAKDKSKSRHLDCAALLLISCLGPNRQFVVSKPPNFIRFTMASCLRQSSLQAVASNQNTHWNISTSESDPTIDDHLPRKSSVR